MRRPVSLSRLQADPVVALAHRDSVGEIEEELAAGHLALIPLASPAQLARFELAVGPFLVSTGATSLLSDVEDLQRRLPSRPILVLTPERSLSGTVDSLRAIGASSRVELLDWPRQRTSLVASVLMSRFRQWADGIHREVLAADHVDPNVRAALVAIVGQRVAAFPHDLRGGGAPERRKGGIAAIAGLSRRSLSRIRSAGVEPTPIADLWIAVQVLAVHELAGVKWETLAHRAGFSGLPGLTALMGRTFKRRLRELSGAGVEHALVRFEEVIQGLLEPPHG